MLILELENNPKMPEPQTKEYAEKPLEIFEDEDIEKSVEPAPIEKENISSVTPVQVQTPPDFFSKYKIPIIAAACFALGSILFFGVKYFRQGNVAAEDFRLENLKIQKMTTGGNVVQTAVSPDGKTIIYATIGENKQQTLWSKRVGESNAVQLIAASNTKYYSITVSLDNNFIYYVTESENSNISSTKFRSPAARRAKFRKI